MKTNELNQLKKELREIAGPGELDSLLATAQALEGLRQPTRDPLRRAATLEAVLSPAGEKPVRGGFGRLWFALPAFAVVLLAVVLVGGAQSAQPGQPLYSVKRLSENARLAVTLSPAAKARHCSTNMRRRADELAMLPAGASSSTISELTGQIVNEAQEFGEYAKDAGTERTALEALRGQDISYVKTKLEAASAKQTTPADQDAMKRTIEELAKLTA